MMKTLKKHPIVYGLIFSVCFAIGAIAQDATTSNLQFLLMGTGLHSNDWGTQTNSNMTKIENAVAGFSTVTTTGGTVTLTNDQARYAAMKATGTLSNNATVLYPSTPRMFTFWNGTAGSYTVTVSCGGGTNVTVAQGQADKLICDGSNVVSSTPAAATDRVPVGTVFHYGGASAPANYALCDGSAVSRATYATLFSAISTTYGAGDGSTTFNLPDSRGRVLASADAGTGRLNSWAAGATGGESLHTMTTGEMVSHGHTLTDPGHVHSTTDPGHSHNVPTLATLYSISVSGPISYPVLAGTNPIATSSATTGLTINSHTTGISIANTGSTTPFNNVQPTLVTTCIIRVQ